MVLMLSVSLFACKDETPSQIPTSSETSDLISTLESESESETKTETEIQEDPEETQIYLNERATIGDFEFEITNVRYVTQYSTSSTIYRPKNGSHFIQVDYIVKNISKSTKNSPLYCLTADYDDGYIFNIQRSYRNVSLYNGGVENPCEMPPLSKEIDCRAYIPVPQEVYESEKPLFIKIVLSDGEGVANAVFNIRPMDEKQKEAFYNKATNYIDNATYYGHYYLATTVFEILGDYKDSVELNEKAKLYRHALSYNGSREADNFFLERLDDFPTIKGDEIPSIFVGNIWDHSSYVDHLTFNQDGSFSFGERKSSLRWYVEGNNLIIKDGGNMYTYEVRSLIDGVYLLLEDGVPKKTLMKVE